MLSSREGLRPRQPKKQKKPPKTNAEKCKDYRDRLKREEPEKYAELKRQNCLQAKNWRDGQTEEQRANSKELARLRIRKFREKHKQEQKQKTKTPTKSPGRATRQSEAKAAEVREKARLRQAKRRAKLKETPQKLRRERERERQRKRNKRKEKATPEEATPCLKVSLKGFLKKTKDLLKRQRSKVSLVKLAFLKNVLNRNVGQQPEASRVYYERRAERLSHVVQDFLSKKAVDVPFQKAGRKPKKVLTKSMIDLYLDFKKEHNRTKVSFSTFKRRRPSHILLSGSQKFVQCLCEKCVNVMLLVDVVNSYLYKKGDAGTEGEELCKMTSVEELVGKTLCENVMQECVERKCEKCGVDNLISFVKQIVGDRINEVREWRRWEKTSTCRKDLVKQSDTVHNIIDKLRQDLIPLSKHLKTAEWQRKQYQKLKENLPPGHGILTVDFAENYLCKYQHEVQSAHWSYHQVSVHPCVFFYRCPISTCHHIVTDYQVFLSEDLKHDAHMTKHIFDMCFTYAESKGIVSLQVFSDGCGSQYKSKLPFLHLTELQALHLSLRLGRHFFGSNHGKSLCDSCGGTVKNCASSVVRNGQAIIQNASDMFEFCKSKLVVSSAVDDNCQHMVRDFVLVSSSDLDRSISSEQLLCVKGTRDLHCLKLSFGSDAMDSRLLSCFCPVCLVGEEGKCENEDFVLKWKSVQVRKKRESETMNSVVSDHVQVEEVTCFPDDFDTFNSSLLELRGLDRDSFFCQLQSMFSLCVDICEVEKLCMNVEHMLSQFPLSCNFHSFLSTGSSADKVACSLRPRGLESLYPALTIGDGNCMPRAVGLACCGSQDFHLELRCRTVVEVTLNKNFYLEKPANYNMQIALLSPCGQGLDLENENCLPAIFESEILETIKLGRPLGLWQLEAFANVVNVNILSIYLSKGPPSVRKLFNRYFTSRFSCHPERTVPIMWSSDRTDMTDSYWVANHIVPLLPMSSDIMVSFEDYTRDHSSYSESSSQ